MVKNILLASNKKRKSEEIRLLLKRLNCRFE